ncbi:MAG TPA: hypothetical protein VLL52_21100, partial [Anaerolineae bacterium]|nr:hypothetical protein [Anaerolineae bacterium]
RRPRGGCGSWKVMGARHSAREGRKFLGRFSAECHAVTLGRAQGRGWEGRGRRPRGGCGSWKVMGARHSAREGETFLGLFSAECLAVTMGWDGGGGEG